MHSRGALLTLFISLLAHITAAISLNTTLLAHDSQHHLETRGNAVSAAKQKLTASPADGSHSSSGSTAQLLRPKIQCFSNQRVHCVGRCSCTTDGTIQCNDENAHEIGSFVPHSKELLGENAEKQMGSVTEVCSKICGCEIDGTFRLGGRARMKVDTSKEQNPRAGLLDKVVREGRRTVMDSIPEVNLPVLPHRPSPHTAEIYSSSFTADVAPAEHPINVVDTIAKEKSSARKKQRFLGKLRRRPKASRTVPTLPFTSSSIPQIYWDMFELFPESPLMRPSGPDPDPGHLLPSPPIATASMKFQTAGRTRKAVPVVQPTRTQRTRSSRPVPVLSFPASQIPEWMWDVPLRDLDAQLRLSSGKVSPPVDHSRSGSTPSLVAPPHQQNIEMGGIRPTLSRQSLADEPSSSTDAPRIYRRGNTQSAKKSSDGYEAIPESPPETLNRSSRRRPRTSSGVSPTVCVSAARVKCESGCYCADDGNVACDRRTDAKWREISLTSSIRGQDPKRLLEATKIYLMNMCVPICGCEENGITRLNGRTKEEWLELRKQAAKGRRKSGDENNKLDTSGSPEKQVKPESAPAADENTPLGPLTAIVHPPSLIRRGQALIANQLHSPVGCPRLVRCGDMENAAETMASFQPICQSSSRIIGEKKCHCTGAGKLRSDTIIPRSFAGNEVSEMHPMTIVKLRQNCAEQFVPDCKCEDVSLVQLTAPANKITYPSTNGSKIFETRQDKVFRSPSTKALTEPAASIRPDPIQPLARRTQTPSEPEGSINMSRRPICSRWDLERKRQCEARCYCNDAGEVKCDTQYPEHFNHLVLYAHFRDLSKDAADRMRADQITTVTNFCVPVCRCPLVPSHSTSNPASSSQESHAGQLPPPSHSRLGTSSSSTLASSLHQGRGYSQVSPVKGLAAASDTNHLHLRHSASKVSFLGSPSSLRRRGRPIPKHDHLKPTCQGQDNDYCQLVCNCRSDGSIHCDIRHIPHIPAPGQTMRLIFQHNAKLDEYCSTGCKCQKHSDYLDPSALAASAPTGDAVRIPAPSGSSDIPSSSSDFVSLHRRGRPMPDPERIDPSVKPICTGHDNKYCTARCRCTIAGTVKCDMRLGLPTDYVPSEPIFQLMLEENRKLQASCAQTYFCEKDSLKLVYSAQAGSPNTEGISQSSPSPFHNLSTRAYLSNTPRSLYRRGDKKRKKTEDDSLADTATSKYRLDKPQRLFKLGTGPMCTYPRNDLCDLRCICKSMGRVSCSGFLGDPTIQRAARLALETQIDRQHATIVADIMSNDMEYLTVYCARGCRCGDPSSPPSLDTARKQKYKRLYKFARVHRRSDVPSLPEMHANKAAAIPLSPSRSVEEIVHQSGHSHPLRTLAICSRQNKTICHGHGPTQPQSNDQPQNDIGLRLDATLLRPRSSIDSSTAYHSPSDSASSPLSLQSKSQTRPSRPIMCVGARKSFCEERCFCTPSGVLQCDTQDMAKEGADKWKDGSRLWREFRRQVKQRSKAGYDRDVEVYCAGSCRCEGVGRMGEGEGGAEGKVEGGKGVRGEGRWGVTRDAGKYLAGRPVVG